MTTKLYYSEKTIKEWVHNIMREMRSDGFTPDYVVGLTRGGLNPASMISYYLDVPMHTLDVQLRDGTDTGPESNLWMAEDAFGYLPTDVVPRTEDSATTDASTRKNILIVDDINDTGATLNWIKQDWQSGCLLSGPAWDDIWGNNVRIAVLVDNAISEFKDVDYVGTTINKLENPIWVVFPWEEWWR